MENVDEFKQVTIDAEHGLEETDIKYNGLLRRKGDDDALNSTPYLVCDVMMCVLRFCR